MDGLSAVNRLLRFGVFELNLDTEELRKEGIALKLGPQPFRVLAMLAGRSGQIVSREEIHQELWGEETYVDFEHGLNQCIKQIRNALNDHSSRPLYVETIPRKGYRFLAPVTSKNIAVSPKVTASSSGPQPTAGGQGAGTTVKADSVASPVTIAPGTTPARDLRHPQAAARDRATPKDASEPSTRSWRGRVIGALALAGLAVVGIVFYWHSQKANALMEKDTVVLADFANSTGEAVFDDTLKQALRIQLEQSPFLNLLSDQKMTTALKLSGRSPGDRLTPEVARDICQRVGSKAMLTGSIAQLGSQYIISVQAVNCNTGDLLAEAQERETNKEDVLKALDRAALSVRRKLGESLHSVQSFSTPVEATTPSLEALKAYSVGRKTWAIMGDTAAIPFFNRAVELDPNFAMAYRSLASVYNNLNQPGRAAENAGKAYDLRDKVSETERLRISAFYYFVVTGELEKAAQIYEVAQREYPNDPGNYKNLAAVLGILGDNEGALVESKEALRLEPAGGGNYANLGQAYVAVNRYSDAEAVYREAERRKLEGEWILGNRYALAFVELDFAEMAKLVSAAEGKMGTEDLLLATHSDTQAWYGKLQSARELTRRAMDSATKNDAKETAAIYQAAAALREAESGNRQRARDEAKAALRLAPDRNVQAVAALALARAGDATAAEKLAAELDRKFPLDTLVQKYWLPSIKAASALNTQLPDHAIELLKTASVVEFAAPTNVAIVLVPAYLRGEAYLMSGQGKPAQAEFQKFIDQRGLATNFQWGALARLGIARAYALQADTDPASRDKARAAYQEFLTLWKDADPDIPIYQQAKAEYAKLAANN